MTFPEFDKLMDEVYSQLKGMRETKGKEYANHDTDRLANFKEIAKEIGISSEAVLLVYSEKHGRAIKHYCKTGKTHSTESIQGRIKDRILYDFLLLGLIEDRAKSPRSERHERRIKSPTRIPMAKTRISFGAKRKKLK